MPTLLMNRPGQAVALEPEPGDLGLPLTIDGIQGSWFPGFSAILVGIAVRLDGNFQFLHTLKDLIYVYAFGDRISQVKISGLAFAGACPGGGPSGFEQALDFYAVNRIANRQLPIQVAIGASPAGLFRGYLTNFSGDLDRPEYRMTQFGLLLQVFPGR